MEKEKIEKFIGWLSTNIDEFKDQNPEDIVNTINSVYETDEGKQAVETLWNTFIEQESKSQSANKFKLGGKLAYVTQLYKAGGKVKKCSCGCAMKKVLEKGGVIEKCSCGCKRKKVESHQEGGTIPIQNVSFWDKIFNRYKLTKFNDGRDGYGAQLLSNGKLSRIIVRPNGHYNNTTWQIIDNYGTPDADTTYISPKLNEFKVKDAPTWTNTFNRVFNPKK